MEAFMPYCKCTFKRTVETKYDCLLKVLLDINKCGETERLFI